MTIPTPIVTADYHITLGDLTLTQVEAMGLAESLRRAVSEAGGAQARAKTAANWVAIYAAYAHGGWLPATVDGAPALARHQYSRVWEVAREAASVTSYGTRFTLATPILVRAYAARTRHWWQGTASPALCGQVLGELDPTSDDRYPICAKCVAKKAAMGGGGA